MIATSIHRFDDAGCMTPSTDESDSLVRGEQRSFLDRIESANYRSPVILDTDLSMVPFRQFESDSPGIYPWHASVQLLKPLEQGFVIGGGIIVGPNKIITAAHMGVDETYCYSRHPYSGESWDNGEFTCGNITGTAIAHPDGIDIAVVQLSSPESEPFGQMATNPIEAGQDFYSSNWSANLRHAFTDGTIESLGFYNSDCSSWPASSSFISEQTMVGPGDSGGPAWVGDEIVGIVHGQACIIGPEKHVWVHVPGVLDFINSV